MNGLTLATTCTHPGRSSSGMTLSYRKSREKVSARAILKDGSVDLRRPQPILFSIFDTELLEARRETGQRMEYRKSVKKEEIDDPPASNRRMHKLPKNC
jgi:hypothetical protein